MQRQGQEHSAANSCFRHCIQLVRMAYPQNSKQLPRVGSAIFRIQGVEGCDTYLTLHNTHFTLHTTYYSLNNKHYSLHRTQYTLQTTHYKLHTVHYTLHTTHYTLHTTNYTLHRVQRTEDRGFQADLVFIFQPLGVVLKGL